MPGIASLLAIAADKAAREGLIVNEETLTEKTKKKLRKKRQGIQSLIDKTGDK